MSNQVKEENGTANTQQEQAKPRQLSMKECTEIIEKLRLEYEAAQQAHTVARDLAHKRCEEELIAYKNFTTLQTQYYEIAVRSQNEKLKKLGEQPESDKELIMVPPTVTPTTTTQQRKEKEKGKKKSKTGSDEE